MDNKAAILNSIQKNKGPKAALPTIPVFGNHANNLAAQFKASVELNAGKCVITPDPEEINRYIREHFSDAKTIVSLIEGIKGNRNITDYSTAQDLNDIDLAIIRGAFGVAENAAIWLPESMLHFRALPFITQHLILLLSKDDIVPTMHEAYQRTNLPEEGYGVFIAGPSKTADIEQNLVIGAHGARSLTVFLV